MALNPLTGSSGRVKILIFLTIAVLILAIGYSIHSQVSRSVKNHVIEAGLIEAGDMPTIYFNLKNTGSRILNYTYIVTSNSTEKQIIDKGLILNIHLGQTFYYTLILKWPEQTMLVKLEIYIGEEESGQTIYRQTWLMKAQL
jgi:hypothetical protein